MMKILLITLFACACASSSDPFGGGKLPKPDHTTPVSRPQTFITPTISNPNTKK